MGVFNGGKGFKRAYDSADGRAVGGRGLGGHGWVGNPCGCPVCVIDDWAGTRPAPTGCVIGFGMYDDDAMNVIGHDNEFIPFDFCKPVA